MTATTFEIPLQSVPQVFSVTLAGVTYQVTLLWRDPNGWVIDIADVSGTLILAGIPLVTGADLLEQFGYLNLGGKLFCSTDHDQDAPPGFDNLGSTAHLYFTTDG